MLRLSLLLATLLYASSAPAAEDPACAPDQAMLSRNASLKAISSSHPDLVCRTMAAMTQQRLMAEERAVRAPTKRKPQFSKKRDPDLAALERSIPEANHDLFLLIKQAATKTKR